MTTIYKSKNYDKRLSKWCAENRKAKAIRNSLTNEQREQVKKDIENACNFINQTFKNMESKLTKEKTMMKSGESVIYRGHTIFCNYEKVKPNKFEFGYDVIDQDEGILGRYSTYDQAEKAITKNRNNQLRNKL